MNREVRVACTREMRNSYKILVEKDQGTRQLARNRHKWDSNIILDTTDIVYGAEQWIQLA